MNTNNCPICEALGLNLKRHRVPLNVENIMTENQIINNIVRMQNNIEWIKDNEDHMIELSKQLLPHEHILYQMGRNQIINSVWPEQGVIKMAKLLYTRIPEIEGRKMGVSSITGTLIPHILINCMLEEGTRSVNEAINKLVRFAQEQEER